MEKISWLRIVMLLGCNLAMPFIFTASNQARTHPDPETDRTGCYKRGYICSLYPDGTILGASQRPPAFAVFRVTDADKNEETHWYLREEWRREVDVELINPQAPPTAQRFRVTTNPNKMSSVSNLGHALTNEINALLSGRNVVVQSVVNNDATFDINVADEEERESRIAQIKQEAMKTVCRRMYRVPDAVMDAAVAYNAATGLPYEVTFADLGLIERRNEI